MKMIRALLGSATFWSVVVRVPIAIAGALILVAIAGAFTGRVDWWLVGMQGSLTIVGGLSLLAGAILAHTWFQMWRTGSDAAFDRTADPVPVPPELLPTQAEVLRLGFVPVGQSETRTATMDSPLVYHVFATPSDPRIVASLSFSRTRTIFTSYLPDGRVIESGYPPLGLADAKVPKGWRPLPEWAVVNECTDGIEPTFRLHQACLATEAGLGYPALPIPDLATTILWDNIAMARVRDFHRRQLWQKTRGIVLYVLVGPVLLWMGLLATWR